MRGFDYYIYIDYSEDLVGYDIIEKNKVKNLLSKISKFHHYKKIKHKKQYILAIKKRIVKENIKSFLLKCKIEKVRYNAEIFANILKFVKEHDNCIIFISVDNNQYDTFIKLFKIVPHKKHVVVVKENKLKKDSLEYKLSLIIDNLLNIKRKNEQSK